jgi:hypothetical protein
LEAFYCLHVVTGERDCALARSRRGAFFKELSSTPRVLDLPCNFTFTLTMPIDQLAYPRDQHKPDILSTA